MHPSSSPHNLQNQGVHLPPDLRLNIPGHRHPPPLPLSHHKGERSCKTPPKVAYSNIIKGCARLRARRHLPPWTDPWRRRQVSTEQKLIFVFAVFDL